MGPAFFVFAHTTFRRFGTEHVVGDTRAGGIYIMFSRKLMRASLALALMGMSGACGSDSKPAADGSASLVDGSVPRTDDASMGMDAARDGAVDAKVSDAGDAAVVDARSLGTAPVLESSVVRQSGRFGHDLRIEVVGTDPDGDTIAMRVQFFDAQGVGIPLVAPTGTQAPDLSPASLPLEKELAATPHAVADAVLANFYRQNGNLKSAKVTLVDDAGNVSNTLDVQLTVQPAIEMGGLCDTNYINNRCQDGLGCKGALPATCQLGEAPKITNAGYYTDEFGPRILIQGTDADDDVNGYIVEFFDTSMAQVFVDLDGELGPDPAVSSFTGTVDVMEGSGKFFFRLDQTEGFTDMVKRVRLTATDLGNNHSTPVVKTLNDTDTAPSSTGAPIIAAGGVCDSRGFNRCAANYVCAPTTAGATTTTCLQIATARTRACGAAQVLDPFKGITSVRGSVTSPSLWDTPDGCSTNNPKFAPDSVVKLTLTRPVSKVVLSSDHPFTSFDTALYMLSKCDMAPTAAWCADDQAATATNRSFAVLEIMGPLPAQDYFVIVDSFPGSASSNWQIDVTVTE